MIHSADKSWFERIFTHRRRVASLAAAALLLALVPTAQCLAANDPPTEAVALELCRPGDQLARVLDLFSKTKVPHPAAALAAWKRAKPAVHSLGKGTEAIIALLNPEMVAELTGLDAARGVIVLGGDPGPVRWRVTLPRDDGAFEAFISALTLTEGRSAEPLHGVPVRELGKQGSALAAADGRGIAFASDRAELDTAINLLKIAAPVSSRLSGLHFRVVPEGLSLTTSLNLQRLRAGLMALGSEEIVGRFHLEADSIDADWVSTLKPNPALNRARIELTWLDGLPAENALAAFASPVETDPKSLEQLFAIADRIEKADPSRREVAPLRIRLNLLAATRGVRPETEIWPKLRGLSAVVSAQAPGVPLRVVVGLHARDVDAAKALASITLPKLLGNKAGGGAGDIGGQTIGFEQRDATVWIGYGEGALRLSIEADSQTKPSVGGILRKATPAAPPSHFAAIWPGKLPDIVSREDALADALAGSPPIIWTADSDGIPLRGRIVWGNLRDTLKRWLDAVPMATLSEPAAAQ